MASSEPPRPTTTAGSQDPKPSMSAAETSDARSKNLKLVFVTGGPGSGKGTQCTKIVENFGFEHLSAGDVLRLEQNSGTETGDMIKGMIKEGKLVPSETTVKLILKAISESSNNKFLIDGFPRNDENREIWDRVAGLSPEFILFITGSEEEMERRVLSRNEGRDDDNIETIRKRFKVFNESTLPVIKHYESIATVHKINGLMTVDEVFAQIRPLFEPIVQEELLQSTVDLLEGLDTGNYKTYQRYCHPAVTVFEPHSQGSKVDIPIPARTPDPGLMYQYNTFLENNVRLWYTREEIFEGQECGQLVEGIDLRNFKFNLGQATGLLSLSQRLRSTVVAPKVSVLGNGLALVLYTRVLKHMKDRPEERALEAYNETGVWRRLKDEDSGLVAWKLVHYHRSVAPTV